MPYSDLALVDDPDALLEVGVDYMESAIPGFVARPGNAETVLLEAQSQIAAEVVQQAELPPPLAFAWAGESLFGIPPLAATPASSTATITFASDTPATMIVAQSLISVPHPSGTSMIFTTDADVTAPSGGGDVLVGVTALEAGADANGAFGASQFIDDVDGVTAVYVATAAGGVDAESDSDYLDRLADALTLLAPRPILPNDFAVMARQVPGVGRASAIDLYQPGTDDNITAAQAGGPLNVEGAPVNAGAGVSPVERCVTTVITGLNGQPPTQAIMHSAWLTLDGAREVNFLAYVMAPRYHVVDVHISVKKFAGYLDSDVEAAVELMLSQWLDPNRFAAGAGDVWAIDNTLRIYEAVDWANRADGVNYVLNGSVQFSVDGAALTGADVVFTDKAWLPLSGTHTVVVS